jgi:hypothetical protein
MSNSNMNLPVKTGDDFIGELETMDLSSLKKEQFLVAVNQGDRSGVKFVCSTVRGVYTFEEMCEAVGCMWQQQQHHAKVIILQKNATAAPKFLDENTVDFIEAHFENIIMESMLGGIFDEDKEYTCRAGIVEGDNEDNPLAVSAKKAAAIEEEEKV